MTRARFMAVATAVVGLGAAGWWLRTKFVSIHGMLSTPSQATAAAPVDADASQAGIRRGDVSIDTRQQQSIGVRTITVTRSSISGVITATGAVRYDETRLSDVNVKVEGWIRELYVDYTGQAVQVNQPLFSLYSPTLIGAQAEYLLAVKARDQLQASTIADARDQADRLVVSARQRLMVWDLPPEAMTALDEKRQTQDTVTFRAPLAGVVTEKTAVVGLHVMPGQTLYKIADLSVVWVEADLYENELSLVRPGQPATVTVDAYPSEHFGGHVVFVSPYLDEKTRTNRVRIALDNPAGRLKPGMFANVELHTTSGTGLMVPADAVLDSGAEQMVFVSQGDGHFTPRHVKVGRRVGGEVQILDGLKDGESIATGAAFFLDSESQFRSGLAGYEDASPPMGSTTPASALAISLRTEPPSPTSGENVFVVTVKDPAGLPVTNAEVSVQLFMPGMPTMNMPPMRNEVALASSVAGEYRGTGQIMMAGRWDATVIVSKSGRRLGTTQTTLVAR